MAGPRNSCSLMDLVTVTDYFCRWKLTHSSNSLYIDDQKSISACSIVVRCNNNNNLRTSLHLLIPLFVISLSTATVLARRFMKRELWNDSLEVTNYICLAANDSTGLSSSPLMSLSTKVSVLLGKFYYIFKWFGKSTATRTPQLQSELLYKP